MEATAPYSAMWRLSRRKDSDSPWTNKKWVKTFAKKTNQAKCFVCRQVCLMLKIKSKRAYRWWRTHGNYVEAVYLWIANFITSLCLFLFWLLIDYWNWLFDFWSIIV
jgi:hypothetical protein